MKYILAFSFLCLSICSFSQIITYETVQTREYESNEKKVLKDSIYLQHGRITVSKDKKEVLHEEGEFKCKYVFKAYDEINDLYYYTLDNGEGEYVINFALHKTGSIILSWVLNKSVIFLVRFQIITFKELG